MTKDDSSSAADQSQPAPKNVDKEDDDSTIPPNPECYTDHGPDSLVDAVSKLTLADSKKLVEALIPPPPPREGSIASWKKKKKKWHTAWEVGAGQIQFVGFTDVIEGCEIRENTHVDDPVKALK